MFTSEQAPVLTQFRISKLNACNVLRKKTNFKFLWKVNRHLTTDCLYFGLFFPLGRLGQLGLKEGFPSAVKNISSVIGMFIQHARDEGNTSAVNHVHSSYSA